MFSLKLLMRYTPVGSMENWFIKRIREPTMPRPNWWSWENQWCRCNNSSPRYTRENHYAISCIKTKSFSGFQFARRITLLILPKSCGEVNAFPIAKLTNIFENECVTEKKIAAYDTSDTSGRFNWQDWLAKSACELSGAEFGFKCEKC